MFHTLAAGVVDHWYVVHKLTVGKTSSAFAKQIYGLFLITLLITIITLMGMESAD